MSWKLATSVVSSSPVLSTTAADDSLISCGANVAASVSVFAEEPVFSDAHPASTRALKIIAILFLIYVGGTGNTAPPFLLPELNYSNVTTSPFTVHAPFASTV